MFSFLLNWCLCECNWNASLTAHAIYCIIVAWFKATYSVFVHFWWEFLMRKWSKHHIFHLFLSDGENIKQKIFIILYYNVVFVYILFLFSFHMWLTVPFFCYLFGHQKFTMRNRKQKWNFLNIFLLFNEVLIITATYMYLILISIIFILIMRN